MKVHNKGQVVIPARIRRQMNIDIGDRVEVCVARDGRRLKISPPPCRGKPSSLAGSLSHYRRHRRHFPNRQEMHRALEAGLADAL
ncbi:MAG: AbrB/MazE/SpoVT family DNA-binding domain-containing protein [Elusimicrobia bacterium]|nr:AbrB/MazE/SpoVT family DNA-binding domain-containing protein [Elusimicrobiota bacterium]MBP9698913.1 AbrB/MazE/SpoVT family DNA-binding domain-containing protein [Elusimicrobiota bacterium]